MSVIGHSPLAGASGAAGGDEATYVDDVFSTFLYDGNGGTQTITNGLDLSGEGGLVWIKNRSTAASHVLFDTERGASTGTSSTQNKALSSNLTSAEGLGSSVAGISSFNSNGFTLDGSQISPYNANGPSTEDYVSWAFRKAPGFFDVVTYSGTGSVQNISHSLGSVPGMIMIHCRDGSHDWEVYHRSTGATKSLHLNSTDGQRTDSTVWNNTTPTSSVFTVGTSTNVNQSGHGYVAYVFAHDEQSFGTDSDESIIKCGSFTTPSSGSFTVDLGFEPQWLMVHRTSVDGGSWTMRDVMRGWKVDGFERLFAESSQVEDSSWINSIYFPVTSTGFSSHSDFLGANFTHVYIAIRRPNKPPTAGTDVYATDVGSSSSVIPTWDSGFPIDFALARTVSGTNNWWTISRLTGTGLLQTHTTTQEVDGGINWVADSNVGWGKAYSSANRSWMFKRAPGFFDVVAYRGSNSSGSTSYTHNLEVVPELMVIKCRNAGGVWYVYSSATGSSKYLSLSGTNAEGNLTWTTPTATEFTAFAGVNATHEDYIVYLFATLDGISKVGSYTGTGGNINVDCGFTAGARFVLIKRRDSTGDWYVWDTARGIVSGNDPYLLINSTAGEVTNTDYIDPLNAGFTVTSSAPAALNTSGGTYLFLAIS